MGLRAEVYTDADNRVVDKISGLQGKQYVFYWCESLGIVLDSYCELARATTRHKFNPAATWDRLDRRSNRIEKPDLIPAVATAARNIIRDQIVFKGGW